MDDLEQIRKKFRLIYDKDSWHGGSGPGSLPNNLLQYRSFIEAFVYDNNIKDVTDLGCGDWQFSRYINWSSAKYTGIDLVEHLIDHNNEHYGSEKITFSIFRSMESLPGGDLLLCKEVLQHLPTHIICDYLEEIKRRYKYALITNSVAPGDVNGDIQPGGFRPLRVDLPPFNATGVNVLSYNVHKVGTSQFWKNNVFLMLGNP